MPPIPYADVKPKFQDKIDILDPTPGDAEFTEDDVAKLTCEDRTQIYNGLVKSDSVSTLNNIVGPFFSGKCQARIKGTVIDSDGMPVTDAELIVSSGKGSVTRNSRSDLDGRYLFSELPPGKFKLHVTAARHGEKSLSGKAEIGRNTTVTVELGE
jgi:hypothetical protein